VNIIMVVISILMWGLFLFSIPGGLNPLSVATFLWACLLTGATWLLWDLH